MARAERECPKHELLRCLLRYGEKHVLQSCFDRILPPNDLQDCLSTPAAEDVILRLLRDGRMDTSLYLRLKSARPVSSEEFGTFLQAELLRVSPKLEPPDSFEWDFRRHKHLDNNVTVNIARLRDYQVEFEDLPIGVPLDDAKFEEDWAKVSRTIIALAGTVLSEERGRHEFAISQMRRSQEFVKINQKLEHLEGMVIPLSYSTGQR